MYIVFFNIRNYHHIYYAISNVTDPNKKLHTQRQGHLPVHATLTP